MLKWSGAGETEGGAQWIRASPLICRILPTLLVNAKGSQLHLCTRAAYFYGLDGAFGSTKARQLKHFWRFKQIG